MTQQTNRYGALAVALAAAVGVVLGVAFARVAGNSPTAMPGG